MDPRQMPVPPPATGHYVPQSFGNITAPAPSIAFQNGSQYTQARNTLRFAYGLLYFYGIVNLGLGIYLFFAGSTLHLTPTGILVSGSLSVVEGAVLLTLGVLAMQRMRIALIIALVIIGGLAALNLFSGQYLGILIAGAVISVLWRAQNVIKDLKAYEHAYLQRGPGH